MTAFGSCGFYNRRKFTMEDAIDSNRLHGFHFFDAATMKFFNSRIESNLLENLCFITSEQDQQGLYFEGKLVQAWDGERRFTIRLFKPQTGDIETLGEFGAHNTLADAIAAARCYGNKIEARSKNEAKVQANSENAKQNEAK